VACVVVGAVLTLRPFTSLSVLVALLAASAIISGVTDVLMARAADAPRATLITGGLWIILGLGVALWPGLTVSAVALWAGIALILAGSLRILGGVTGTADQRITAVISGGASFVFGVLALSWPDITVLVVAVVFGARTVLFGLSLITGTLRRRGAGPAAPASAPAAPTARGRIRRWARSLWAVASLLAALLLLLVSAELHTGGAAIGAFYTPPRDVPAKPGVLLRSQPFTNGVPAGAHAWRILYTTTRDAGIPAVASAIVMAPEGPASVPRDVVAWAHGTTGVAQDCAPSLLSNPWGSAGALIDQATKQGWVVVATDYAGMGTAGPSPYLIGEDEGRSVLDAVRAAKQLPGLNLAPRTVVWGHSQGGNGALWAGILAPRYAPDADVVGVAAAAPATDLTGLVDNLATLPGGPIFQAYTITAYSQAYHDVHFNDYVVPAAQTIAHADASRCLSETAILASVVSSLVIKNIFVPDPTSGAFGLRLTENAPTGRIQAPLLIAQGGADPLVLPSVQAQFVKQLCASGQRLEYRTYAGRDHNGVIAADSPAIGDIVSFTHDRLHGVIQRSGCRTIAR